MSISNSSRVATALLAFGTISFAAACSDSPAPLAPASAPSLGVIGSGGSLTNSVIGDTVVSVITLLPNTSSRTFGIGHENRIEFPQGASSVCDIATSSYGPGTWDAPCKPSTVPVVITAKTWTDARGLSHADFQPAMRFVPNAPRSVLLEMRNKNGLITPDMRIDFCSASSCINEAATDPSVRTFLDAANGRAGRRIKHFTGYMVTVGLDSVPPDTVPPPTGW